MKKMWSIFRDDNSWNEKTIIGFLSFAMMVLTGIIDIGTGVFGHELEIQKFVYNSFLIVTLGSFGIAGCESVLKNKSE
jgi:hypothetical protein